MTSGGGDRGGRRLAGHCVDVCAQRRGEFCGALSRISILFDSIRVRARRTSRKPTFARTRIYPTVRPNGTDFIMPGLHGRIRHAEDERGQGRQGGLWVGRVGVSRGREAARRERRVDSQPIWNAKLLSQRICDAAANGATGNIIATPITPVAPGIMLINTVKSTFDAIAARSHARARARESSTRAVGVRRARIYLAPLRARFVIG